MGGARDEHPDARLVLARFRQVGGRFEFKFFRAAEGLVVTRVQATKLLLEEAGLTAARMALGEAAYRRGHTWRHGMT